MARPSEVIQEARHCFARNKVETMSDNSVVLVKVSSVWGIVFSTAALGTGSVISWAQRLWARPSPPPTKAHVYPHSAASTLPGSGSAFTLQER